MGNARLLQSAAITAGIAATSFADFPVGDDARAPALPASTSPCPGDCDGDDLVGINDFLGVIGAWGECAGCCQDVDGDGEVGITEFLLILSTWGFCPPPNDECGGGTPIDRIDAGGVTTVEVDLLGATSSPELHYCLVFPDPKDAWWCLTNSTGAERNVRIETSLDVLVEVYDGCSCRAPLPLVVCGFGLAGTDPFPMPPGGQVTIRLLDHQMLPDEDLHGVMDIVNEPAPLTGP